jgi:hypothetical protein
MRVEDSQMASSGQGPRTKRSSLAGAAAGSPPGPSLGATVYVADQASPGGRRHEVSPSALAGGEPPSLTVVAVGLAPNLRTEAAPTGRSDLRTKDPRTPPRTDSKPYPELDEEVEHIHVPRTADGPHEGDEII